MFWGGCNQGNKEGGNYHCPMHPTYVTDRPGDCPICGMRLVPIETKTEPTVVAKYSCPMHPEVTSDKPDQRCPKCGMKLEPIQQNIVPQEIATSTPAGPIVASETTLASTPEYPGKISIPSETPAHPVNRSGERKIRFFRNPMNPEVTSPVPAKDSMGMDYVPVYADEINPSDKPRELAPITLNESERKLAGVQVAEATKERLTFSTRTVGAVKADESQIRHIHTKISGFVEKLSINFTGQWIKRGEPVLSIYSPELLATQEELLRAAEISNRFAKSDLPEVRRGGAELLKSSRRRLELFDVPERFIEDLLQKKIPRRTVTLNAPVSGFVTSKDIFEGQQIEPGMELFTVTDLSRVWIEADFYEYETRVVQIGQMAKLTFPFDPSMELRGRVSYVYPYLNPESRTLKVRFDFENPKLVLKPSMYVDVTLQIDAGIGIVIPESAVMDTGLRKIVFVQQANGQLVPKDVKVGITNAGKTQIFSGIAVGDKVVTRANFLIDSESRLRAAIGSMTDGSEPQ